MKKDNTHELLVAHSNIKKRGSNKSFGLVFSVVFAIVAFVPLLKSGDVRWWSFVVSVIFLAISFIAPQFLGPLNTFWLKFGEILHSIVSPVIFGAIYYLIVSPIGVSMRLFSSVPLKLKFDPDVQSYWILRDPPGPEADSMHNQF